MSGIMSHPHPYRHHHVNWYILAALLATIAVIGGILVVPYLTVSETAFIPVTGSQNAYTEYLQGEKYIHDMPATMGEVLTSYLFGEKVFYTKEVNSNQALTIYHVGEKHVMSALDYELLTYRMGEKDY